MELDGVCVEPSTYYAGIASLLYKNAASMQIYSRQSIYTVWKYGVILPCDCYIISHHNHGNKKYGLIHDCAVLSVHNWVNPGNL